MMYPIYLPNLGNFHRINRALDLSNRRDDKLSLQIEQLTAMTRELGEALDAQRTMGIALWELLQETGALDGDTLLQKIQEVDERREANQAKVEANPGRCESCDRQLHAHRRSCLYCGDPNPGFAAQRP